MEEARLRRSMADSLYLNLWFPDFDTEEMFAHALGVMRQFPLQPSLVRFIVRGKEFEDGESEAQGEIQVDFGIDIPFLHEELQLTTEVEARVRANVQMLVDFTNRVERNSGTNARLLWSESDENFAHKLVNRLQKVQ